MSKQDLPCRWHEDLLDGSWDTDCGNKFQFNESGPIENGLKFCGYCGKRLKEVRGGRSR